MARILVVDPELRTGHTLVDQLRRLGHAPELQASLRGSEADLQSGALEAVFACVSERSAQAVADAWRALAAPVPLIWCSRFLETAEPLRAAGIGAGFLALPPRLPALMAVLQRHLETAADAGWSGDRFLRQVDGTVERFPPARVAFLAHRVGGSGTLHVGGARLTLRAGRVAGCVGVPGLLGTDGLDLMAALGMRIGAGVAPDAAMTEAAEQLGAWLISAHPADESVVWVDESHVEKRSPVTLPLTVPRMILTAVRSRGAIGARRVALLDEGDPAFRVCAPDDAPETQWGLSPVSLRVLRAATRTPNLLGLLDSLGGRERDDLWEALDYLLTLGLLRKRDDRAAVAADVAGQELPSIEAVGGAVAISVEALDEAIGRAPAPAADPETAALEAELARIEALPPWDVFALEAVEDLEPAELDQRLRARSTAHHPDRHASAPAAQRALHEKLFAVYADAHSALQDEALRREVRARLQARAAGKPYVSDADRKRARLARTKGEHALRARRWDEAIAAFDEASGADPLDLGLQLLAHEARWRGGQATPEATLAAVDALAPQTRGERCERAALRGELMVAAGDEDGAHEAFLEVLEIDPNHVGAQRRVRMHTRRSAKTAPAESSGGLASFFGFGKRK